jgi:predicted O-methyltransferase YrrM
LTAKDVTITPRINSYLASRFCVENPAAAAARARAERDGHAIHVTQLQGAVLRFLVNLVQAERVLEIGTYFGYSAIWMAEGLSANGQLDTIEVDQARAAVARALLDRSGVGERVTILIGDAATLLLQMDGRYDLAFIDGTKGNYPEYLQACSRLVRPGGLIVADNVLWRGEVADETLVNPRLAGVRKFNDTISAAGHRSVILPIGDGMSLTIADSQELCS